MKPVGISPDLILMLTNSDILSGWLSHQFTQEMHAKLTVIYTHQYVGESLVKSRGE